MALTVQLYVYIWALLSWVDVGVEMLAVWLRDFYKPHFDTLISKLDLHDLCNPTWGGV